jgi:alcohol dehydrogenase YqhD (iron-dependent ADH family)
MAEGFPATTGDIFTAADYNGLVAFTIGAANTVDYTATIADAYQVCELMNKATAIAFKIPTNASVAFPIGTVLTVLNIGSGTCTISAVTSGTTIVLSSGATPAQPTLGQYRSAACIKTGTDAWYVVGAIG